MADTTKKISGAVEPYYEYAQQAVDEQAILDKYNAATAAQFAAQREQNRIAENQFYNQMYNTQKTAMDTIRKSNAAAVASGASRGVQAAQELSSLLGLQQESVASATELAQANRQTAQEETAAMLENVLTAYQQAQQERSTLVQQGIEAASVEQERAAANAAAQNATATLTTQASENGTNTYLTSLTQSGINYSDGELTPESQASFNVAMANIGKVQGKDTLNFIANDWAGGNSGNAKATEITSTLKQICAMYGLNEETYSQDFKDFMKLASEDDVHWATNWTGDEHYDREAAKRLGVDMDKYTGTGKTRYAAIVQAAYNNLKAKIQNDYANGLNRKQKSK